MRLLYDQIGVVRSAILACSLFLMTLSSGCATTKIYHLNLDPTTAPVTLAAVANTAADMGYQVTFLATGVNVRYDHDTWIYYSLGEHDYSMCITVDNDVAANQMSGRLGDAKTKAEEIWSRAMAMRQPGSRPAQPGAPGPATPPAPTL